MAFALILFILFVLSVVVLLNRRRKEQRWTYIPLLLFLLFSTIVDIVSTIVFMMKSSHTDILPYSLKTRKALFALFVIVDFSTVWNGPLIFFAFFNLALDRFNAVNATISGSMGRINRVILVSSLGFIILLSIVAPTTGAFYAEYEYLISLRYTDNASQKRPEQLQVTLFIYDSLLAVCTLSISILATYVYRSVKKVPASDKVCFKQQCTCIQYVSIDSRCSNIGYECSGICQGPAVLANDSHGTHVRLLDVDWRICPLQHLSREYHSCSKYPPKYLLHCNCGPIHYPRFQEIVLGSSGNHPSFVNFQYTYVCLHDLTHLHIAPSSSLTQVKELQQLHGEPAFYTPSYIVCEPYETVKTCEYYSFLPFRYVLTS